MKKYPHLEAECGKCGADLITGNDRIMRCTNPECNWSYDLDADEREYDEDFEYEYKRDQRYEIHEEY